MYYLTHFKHLESIFTLIFNPIDPYRKFDEVPPPPTHMRVYVGKSG